MEQEFKCQLCGEDLPTNWHADHDIPYSRGGITNLFNMQALCPRCNISKGNKMNSNLLQPIFTSDQAEFDYIIMKLTNGRIGQRKAVYKIVQRIASGEPFTSIVIPTRYGKSDIIRLVALYLRHKQMVSAAFVLEPSCVLRNQIVSKDDWTKMIERYEVNIQPKHVSMKTFSLVQLKNWTTNPSSSVHLFSLTTQLLVYNIDYFEEWTKFEIARTGKPVLFIVDECHTGSEDNSWGSATERLANAGAKIVLLTATPYRSDNKKIPGFKFSETSSIGGKATKTTRENEQLKIEIFSTNDTIVKLIPDFEVTFREAWDQDVICQINKIQIGSHFRLCDDDGSVTSKELHVLNDEEVRRNLRKIVESETFIKEGCDMLVKRLRAKKQIAPECSAMVFCGDDKEDKDGEGKVKNKQANRIKKILADIDDSLRVAIITSKPENEDEKAEQTIQDYKNGKYDIIIVKQMGGVGLDVPHLKVSLDLSSMRAAGLFLQRLMRTATKFSFNNGRAEMKVCDYISPADSLSEKLFTALVNGEGGCMKIVELLEVEQSYVTTARDEETPQKTILVVDTAEHHNTLDTHGEKLIATDSEFQLSQMIETFPALSAFYTDSAIVELMEKKGIIFNRTTTPKCEPIDMSRETETRRNEINQNVKTWASIMTKSEISPISPNYNKKWQQNFRKTFALLKSSVGVGNCEMKDITDLKKLDVMLTNIKKKISDFTKAA